MLVAIISLVAFVATVLCAWRLRRAGAHTGEPVPTVGMVWGGVFAVIQAFIGVYAALGLVADDPVAAVILNLVLSGAVLLSVSRRRVAAALARIPYPFVISVVLVLLAALFAVLALEVPSNHEVQNMYPLCLLLEWGLIAALLMGLFFLVQRRGAAPAAFVVVFLAIGIAQYFIITFKAQPIQPGDLSALSTAAAVSAGYQYLLSSYCLYGVAFAVVGMVLCQVAGILRPERDMFSRRRLVVNLLVGVACLGGLTAHVTLIDYYNDLGIQVYTWRPLESYYREGFLPCFISSAQAIAPRKPHGYTVEKAQELLSEYAAAYDADEGATSERAAATAQFDEEKPTVIAVMNETFADLSIYQNMHANYQGPEYFKSLSDTLQRGRLYVSAYGGGTANSEFEFLTGNSMSNLGSGVYPYTIYDLSRTENLARQFKEMGYTTTAMHPNHATNWNRENVYQQFGFDSFLSINDFQGSDTLRGMVTDRATYDKIVDLLDSNADPQFIFDVTMQNHSGYDTGLLPADKQQTYPIDGMSRPDVDEYLSLIKESDDALRYFINRLRTMNRKVVLVFFGDHQPFFPNTYNDAWFTGEDEATHAERLWQTDYIIWANYDIAGRSTGSTVDLSTNYLSASLMNLIGAPMTDYQKAHIELQKVIPAINATGFEDENQRWYLASASSDATLGESLRTARSDLATLQFLELFGDGTSVYAKVLQQAANETNPNLSPNGAAKRD
ncbi:LTA synthase family protein [Collinsella vaginalis]|uniref:LTA synthase family protein n=1 Tax=Collinsella vaginalis TaxID=1870987 RepID=UPI000A269BF8|nr:LTA synthase family protein [Collinsella vaginalis]